ncbi:hypothetical protein HAX54_035206, partial [Datura stramonium]|nr:hypothetical protein [Datura stramonium]
MEKGKGKGKGQERGRDRPCQIPLERTIETQRVDNRTPILLSNTTTLAAQIITGDRFEDQSYKVSQQLLLSAAQVDSPAIQQDLDPTTNETIS